MARICYRVLNDDFVAVFEPGEQKDYSCRHMNNAQPPKKSFDLELRDKLFAEASNRQLRIKYPQNDSGTDVKVVLLGASFRQDKRRDLQSEFEKAILAVYDGLSREDRNKLEGFTFTTVSGPDLKGKYDVVVVKKLSEIMKNRRSGS